MKAPENKASLGCGSLILIALIVLIFGSANRGDDKKLAQQIRGLESEIMELKDDIKSQSATLAEIRLSLEKLATSSNMPRPRISPPVSPEAPLPEN